MLFTDLINNDELSSESGVNPYKKSRWRVLAVIISWLSIVATLAIGISEFSKTGCAFKFVRLLDFTCNTVFF